MVQIESFSTLEAALRAAIVPLQIVDNVDASDCVRTWQERVDEIAAGQLSDEQGDFQAETVSCILSRAFGVIAEWPGPEAETSDFRCRASDVLAAALRAALLTQTVAEDTLARDVRTLFEYEMGGAPPRSIWAEWRPRVDALRNAAVRAAAFLNLSPESRSTLDTLVALYDAIAALASRIERPQDERKDLPRSFDHAGALVRNGREGQIEAVGVLRDRSPDGCCVHVVVSERPVCPVGVRQHVSLFLVKGRDLMPSDSSIVYEGRPRKRKHGGDPRVGMRLVPVT